jgi:phosphoribosylaminoimidazole-succinocarboxamide synthase
MARRTKVYEGKAKILYEGPEPGTYHPVFQGRRHRLQRREARVIEGKGVLNNRLSEFFMTGLNEIGVPTHFIRRMNMREQLIRAVEIIPLEVVVRNIAAGSMSKRLGIEEGTPLPRPIVEFYYKNDALGDPLVSEEHILAFGWATQQDLDDMVALALRVNDFLSGVMMGVGIKLVDFKIEIGRIYDGDFQRLVVADEISPDSCRLWDIRTGRKLDKDVFRRDLGNLSDAYTEVARRLGVMPDQRRRRWPSPADELRQAMKARVHVMLKTGVLDPQGEAVRHALGTLGFAGVEAVRQGKVIELDSGRDRPRGAEARCARCARSCWPTP